MPIQAIWKAVCREPRYAGSAGILPAWGKPRRIKKARKIPEATAHPMRARRPRSQGKRRSQGEASPKWLRFAESYPAPPRVLSKRGRSSVPPLSENAPGRRVYQAASHPARRRRFGYSPIPIQSGKGRSGVPPLSINAPRWRVYQAVSTRRGDGALVIRRSQSRVAKVEAASRRLGLCYDTG